MTNPFKVFAEKVVDSKSEIRDRMLSFHYDLSEVTDLDTDDIAVIADEKQIFDIGQYYITARNFCLNPGWATLLYAVPKSMGTTNIGWSNVPVDSLDNKDWYYIPAGTATIIAPTEEEGRRILEAVKAYMEGYVGR